MKIDRRIAAPALALAAALLLVGCGGNDGAKGDMGVAQSPAPFVLDPDLILAEKAEGAYRGTLTPRGYELTMIVLENDVAWGLYRFNNLLVGFFQGAGLSNNGSFTIPDARDYDFVDDVVRSASVSATFFSGVSIQGNVTPDVGIQSSFSATEAALIGYEYGLPASLAQIQGTWQVAYRNGDETGPVDISPAGEISAVTSLGCTYTGTVAPRASGRNVFDLFIRFGAAPCILPGGSMTGIALVFETVTGTQQLLAAAVDGTREIASSFAGQR